MSCKEARGINHPFTFSLLKGVSHLFTFSIFHPFTFKGLRVRLFYPLIMHQCSDILTAHNAFEITHNIHIKHVDG